MSPLWLLEGGYVGLKSTYTVAVLSSRLNHVGVIAIKKHPTVKRKKWEERQVI